MDNGIVFNIDQQLKACPHCDWIGSRLNGHYLNRFQSTFDDVRTMILQSGLGTKCGRISSRDTNEMWACPCQLLGR